MSYFFDRKHPVLLVQSYINKVLKRDKNEEEFPSVGIEDIP